MDENLLIPLPGFSLPFDLPWRTNFISLVDDQLRGWGVVGRFLPPRFFGYYIQNNVPTCVAGRWIVSLDLKKVEHLSLNELQKVTRGFYSIITNTDQDPDFMLIHDRATSFCWLWSFTYSLRFIQSPDPVLGSSSNEEESDVPGSS